VNRRGLPLLNIFICNKRKGSTTGSGNKERNKKISKTVT
jgi:hypothetical protein